MIIKEWEHAGMRCALRHGAFDAPCGYVALPAGHKLHGKTVYQADEDVVVYGGVTFAGTIGSDDLGRFWLGFDMAHACDFDPLDYMQCIRTDDECIAETNRLAEQLAKMEVSA